ncbi:AmpG family muropeptide MFS transporter [soil metagenome]
MKPGIFIPTLYLASGLPYTIVNMMSVVFFKNMHADNEFIAQFTSLLQIPWVIKLFWAPTVDLYGTRRQWIVVSQTVLGSLAIALAGVVEIPDPVKISVGVLVLMAIASATQDISIDGYYMDVLDSSQQSFYVGVRNTAYKMAVLLGSGGLVFLAGKLAESGFGIVNGWAVAFSICAAILLSLSLFHNIVLPRPEQVKRATLTFSEFLTVFRTFFQQPSIVPTVIYILTFRLGDALMLKMAQPFLLDPVEKGGLGISTADLGLIYGTVGTVALLIGGIFGGWLISKQGLKKCLLPTAIVQNSAILLYWVMAILKPPLIGVCVLNAYEQFSYGLGVAAYTVFLLSTVRAEYKAAHYATATGLMALGVLVPSYVSGYLQTWLGYQNFFLLSFLASVPGIIVIFFLPLNKGVENPS